MRLRVVFFVALIAVSCGCATQAPVHSGRPGLFDYFGSAGSPRHSNGERRDAGAFVEKEEGAAATAFSESGLRWPLIEVKVTSPFGKRGKEFHEGIDLRAASGTPVFAAQDGTVLYAGRKIRGYGKMVVLRHDKGIATIYAHNSRVLVKAGQKVLIGQQIAISGKSGKTSGPHLHFEVRSGVAAVDPTKILPGIPLGSRSQL